MINFIEMFLQLFQKTLTTSFPGEFQCSCTLFFRIVQLSFVIGLLGFSILSFPSLMATTAVTSYRPFTTQRLIIGQLAVCRITLIVTATARWDVGCFGFWVNEYIFFYIVFFHFMLDAAAFTLWLFPDWWRRFDLSFLYILSGGLGDDVSGIAIWRVLLLWSVAVIWSIRRYLVLFVCCCYVDSWKDAKITNMSHTNQLHMMYRSTHIPQ